MTTSAAFAAARLDPTLAAPGPDPQSRFAIHRNNVVSSPIDALAGSFPVVQRLVGTGFFRAMASVFVRQSPPRSPILALYGHALPAFVDRVEPASSVPDLADVARLERARVVAYHAADTDALSTDEALHVLGSCAPVDRLILRCHPSLVVPVSSGTAAFVRSVQRAEWLRVAVAIATAVHRGFDLTPALALMMRRGTLLSIASIDEASSR